LGQEFAAARRPTSQRRHIGLAQVASMKISARSRVDVGKPSTVGSFARCRDGLLGREQSSFHSSAQRQARFEGSIRRSSPPALAGKVTTGAVHQPPLTAPANGARLPIRFAAGLPAAGLPAARLRCDCFETPINKKTPVARAGRLLMRSGIGAASRGQASPPGSICRADARASGAAPQ
jgi:hypothetical protein